MLDINALNTQFDEILQSFQKKDIQEWLLNIEEKELLEKLKKGAIVTLNFDTYQVVHVKFTANCENNMGENINYALAA